MKKLLAKEFVKPFVVLALLILKNDETLRMCVHSRAINKIHYCFSIPRLDDLLDQFRMKMVLPSKI